MKFRQTATLFLMGVAYLVATCMPSVFAATQFEHHSFISHVDDAEDTYGVVPPKYLKANEPTTLIVYLHGMGSNIFEPLMFPNDLSVTDAVSKTYPRFVFISCSYGREASWGIDDALRDVTDNIAEISRSYNIEKIILVGSSMGGCTVLTYAATAPVQVKEKLIGVLSVEGAGDLRELYYNTGYAEVQPTLEKAFNGTPKERPEIYRRKSFLRNIPLLDPKLRIFLVSGHQDTTVPPHMQKELYNALRLRDYQVKLKEIEGAHGVPPANNYVEGIAYILNEPVPVAQSKDGRVQAPTKSSSKKTSTVAPAAVKKKAQ